MKTKLIIGWVRQNIHLSLIAAAYIFCIMFLGYQMMHYGKMLGISDYNATTPDINDYKMFLFVVYLLSVLGFAMMILLIGNMINLYRLHKERVWVCNILSKQMNAIEASIEGIAILSHEGKYTYINKAHANHYGYEPAELIGKSWRTLYSPPRVMKIEADVFPVLWRDGGWAGQSWGLKKDGTEFPQDISLKLLDDGGIICTVRDLTEKLKTDAHLRMIKLAVEAAEDGIAITDADNKLLFMNRSFLKIHGYDPYDRENYLNTDWRLLYNEVGQEKINALVLPTTILKGAWSGSLTVMKKDKSLFYGDASLTRLPDGLTIGVMRDVTERRKAELEREELKEQLFQSQKIEAIGRLTNGLVHDFSTILSSIFVSAEHMRQGDLPTEEWQSHAKEILQQTDKARDIVDQLLAFSHKKSMKAGIIDVAQSIVNVKQSFLEILAFNMAIVVDIKSQASYTFGNLGQIERIVTNLCLNGIDAMEGQRGKIAITLKDMDRNLLVLRHYMMTETTPDKIKATAVRGKTSHGKNFLMTGYLLKDRNYIQVTVSDTGRGIAPDILSNIFDPFFTTKSSRQGSGLGLSTVQGMMIASHGAVVVETIPGEGTSVHLFFVKSEMHQEIMPALVRAH